MIFLVKSHSLMTLVAFLILQLLSLVNLTPFRWLAFEKGWNHETNCQKIRRCTNEDNVLNPEQSLPNENDEVIDPTTMISNALGQTLEQPRNQASKPYDNHSNSSWHPRILLVVEQWGSHQVRWSHLKIKPMSSYDPYWYHYEPYQITSPVAM